MTKPKVSVLSNNAIAQCLDPRHVEVLQRHRVSARWHGDHYVDHVPRKAKVKIMSSIADFTPLLDDNLGSVFST